MRLAEETRAEVNAVLKRMLIKHYRKDRRVERQSEEKGGFKAEEKVQVASSTELPK
jgi:CelD/BcsL family acetyltransferase involved in cellulose biosynthesis